MKAMLHRLLVLLACSTPLQAKEPLIWLLTNWPPFIEMNGDQLVGGVTGQQMQMLFARLPEYEHITRNVSLTRLEVELMSQQPVCSMPVQKVERRERFMLFSIPMHLGLGNRVFVRPQTFAELGRPDAVDIAAFLHRSELRGLIQRSRSYSQQIDHAIEAAGSAGNFQVSVLPTENALKMLADKRIDYLIEYPSVVRHWEHQHPGAVPLASLRVNGDAEFALGYLACTQSDWGRHIMPVINAALTKLIHEPAYQALLYSTLNQAEQQAFRQHWQQAVIDAPKARH